MHFAPILALAGLAAAAPFNVTRSGIERQAPAPFNQTAFDAVPLPSNASAPAGVPPPPPAPAAAPAVGLVHRRSANYTVRAAPPAPPSFNETAPAGFDRQAPPPAPAPFNQTAFDAVPPSGNSTAPAPVPGLTVRRS